MQHEQPCSQQMLEPLHSPQQLLTDGAAASLSRLVPETSVSVKVRSASHDGSGGGGGEACAFENRGDEMAKRSKDAPYA